MSRQSRSPPAIASDFSATQTCCRVPAMATIKLDLTGLRCPIPALKTRKALLSVSPGDALEVHCTDPLAVIDIPNLIRETGDKVEVIEQSDRGIVFLIEKARLATL